MKSMPRLLEELQKIVRERGQLPPWIGDFIQPLEEIRKCDNVKEPEKKSDNEESEEDSDDEGITDMERTDSLVFGDSDSDGDEEDHEELEGEVKKATEKEKNNEAREDEDNNVDGDDQREWEQDKRKASEKGKENEAREVAEDDDDDGDGDGQKEQEEEKRKASEKGEENEAAEEEITTNADSSLTRNFVKIEGLAKYICQVEDCAKVVHRCSRKEHLRAKHRLFPPLECNICFFKTLSRSVFDRHKKKIH